MSNIFFLEIKIIFLFGLGFSWKKIFCLNSKGQSWEFTSGRTDKTWEALFFAEKKLSRFYFCHVTHFFSVLKLNAFWSFKKIGNSRKVCLSKTFCSDKLFFWSNDEKKSNHLTKKMAKKIRFFCRKKKLNDLKLICEKKEN